MSVCKYYLRGNCRNGNECRFLHDDYGKPPAYHRSAPTSHNRPPRAPFNQNYRYVAPSIDNRNNNHAQNSTGSRNGTSKYHFVFKWAGENFQDKEKALDILQVLQKEARLWRNSDHFWRFTSRSLFPGGTNLPGWSDQSFEEIRWAYRWMTDAKQAHHYKKQYSDYWEGTERQIVGLGRLDIETLNSLKEYIAQFIASSYKPSSELSSDIDMVDVNIQTPWMAAPSRQTTSTTSKQSIHYTPDDELLEEERAAFQSGVFEFGQIPVHAPPQQFC